MFDSRASFADLMANADLTLTKAAARVRSSGQEAKLANKSTTEATIANLAESVTETAIDAKDALQKLAAADRVKTARRHEKVKLALHVARVYSRLLSA